MTDIILTGKQAAFVAAFVENEALTEGKLPLYEVAVRAGVNRKSASVYATTALQNPRVLAAISERKRLLAERAAGFTDVDALRVLREWGDIAIGDPSEIVGVRRLNCRHCWGVGFAYQHTDSEYAQGTARALTNGDDLKYYDGGGGFYKLRDPNPACPECAGDGVEDVHVKDFRKLTPKQRRLIAGVKQGKHGIEIQFRDQDGALKNLAQYLGLLIDRKEHSGPGGGPIQTATVNYTLPTDPQEAAKQYQQLMEGNRT